MVLAVRAHPRRLRHQRPRAEGRGFRRDQLLGGLAVLGGGMKGVVAVFLVVGVVLGELSLARAQAPAPAAPPGVSGAARVVYIDVQRVLTRSAAGVAAREALEKDRATMQKEMDAKRQELEKMRDELEKKAPLMTADGRR